MGKLSTIAELFRFAGNRKRYWLIPLFVVLIALGVLIVFAESSALAPFIYTLF